MSVNRKRIKYRGNDCDDHPDLIYANILFKYVDRLNDPTPEDPLELIVSEMLSEVAEELSGRLH
jgi:hypothetical protein